MKASDFIQTSDYATLKNDAKTTLTVTLPATASIGASSVGTWTSTTTVGVPGSSIRARISSSVGSTVYMMNTVAYSSSTGATVSGMPIGYDIYATVHRVSATQVRLSVFIPNPYGDTMNITGLARTITAVIATFLPPFA